MNNFQEEVLKDIADQIKKKMAEVSPWKQYDELNEISESDSYLVCYKNDIGQYTGCVKAYWVNSENAFFPCFGDWAFPLKVDLYMKIPEPRKP